MIKMIKMILILFVTIKICFANLIWLRIPQFYVSNYVTNFLDNHQINNCFYKYEDENNLLLKCWKNNQLTNVEITIKIFSKSSTLSKLSSLRLCSNSLAIL